MSKPLLDVESEFELMVIYQTTIESKCVLINNGPKDDFKFSLFEIVKPYPTYEDYLEGNEFVEGEMIAESSKIEDLEKIQKNRRFLLNEKSLPNYSERL